MNSLGRILKRETRGRIKILPGGRQSMLTKLIEVEKIHLNAADYEIRYYQNTNLNGTVRFTSEVEIGRNDKIILDDHSVAAIKYKVNLIFPVSVQTRRGWEKLRS